MFAPIFKFSIKSFEDILYMDGEAFSEILENNGEVTFSYYDEATLIFEQITNKNSSLNFSDIFFSPVLAVLLVVAVMLVWIGWGIYGIGKSVYNIYQIDSTKIRYFTRIEKYPKESILNLRSYIDVIVVVFFVLSDGYLAMGSDVVYRRLSSCEKFDFSNFSSAILIVIFLAVAVFTLKYFANKADKVWANC